MTFLVVVLVIGGATYDLVTSASTKDQQVQASELRGELAQFLLSIREADGSTLLENPAEFSSASRSVSVVSLRRFAFVYWLNAQNAKRFKVAEIAWESPRPCQIEFAESSSRQPTAPGIRVCFAAVPADPSGRYVYFSLKYPSARIRRHVAGQFIEASDRVEITFAGTKNTALTLVFEAPPLALARYPSQMARFDDVHELTGFLGADASKPTKLVIGQVFERDVEDARNSAKHFVTIFGRIDSAMLSANSSDAVWPDPDVKSLKIGVRVVAHGERDGMTSIFEVAPGEKGTALVSLSQAYLAAVPSRARLEVTTTSPDSSTLTVWKSDDVGAAHLLRLNGAWQWIADWWAGEVIASSVTSAPIVNVHQDLVVPGIPPAIATLTAARVALPDIATRAFTWLTVAALLILLLASDWAVYLFRLLRLRGAAFSMVVRHTSEGNLNRYVGREREIGTLARIFDLLIRRGRTRSTHALNRNRRKANDLRIAEAQVVNRKTILEAIGHEIRSPLQSLLTLSRDDAEAGKYLERIRRAVDALYEATSVESGLKSGDIVVGQHDLAAFLRLFALNLAASGKPVAYDGAESGILAEFDPIQLEQILDNIIDNAMRYRAGNTDIELRLARGEQGVELAVFNQGPKIPDSDLERIFIFGISDSESTENAGLGLFASRTYALAMDIMLFATNVDRGVAFTLQFPSSTAKDRE